MHCPKCPHSCGAPSRSLCCLQLPAKDLCKNKNTLKMMFVSSCPACSDCRELSKCGVLFSLGFATCCSSFTIRGLFFHFNNFLGMRPCFPRACYCQIFWITREQSLGSHHLVLRGPSKTMWGKTEMMIMLRHTLNLIYWLTACNLGLNSWAFWF